MSQINVKIQTICWVYQSNYIFPPPNLAAAVVIAIVAVLYFSTELIQETAY